MELSSTFNPRRVARALVTVLALTLIQTVAAPVIAPQITTPQSHAVSGSITATSSTSRSFITIPAGVESISVVVTGGGGGQGGIDGDKAGGKGGKAQRVWASFAVSPGDVVSLFPGNAGSNGKGGVNINEGGTGVGGAVAGGASTLTDSYWNVNGTSYQNPSFSGGGGGKVGSFGSSGSGGGGGAASVVAINRNIVVIAGGAGGGGGAGNATGAQGTDGIDANTPHSNLFYGGTGKDSGAGLSCSATDGGGGGGGGGGYYAGTGGFTELVGNECSGRGGYRGNGLAYNAIGSANSTVDTSETPASPLNGTITYTYDVKSPTVCTPTSTIVDIYTVLKFDASVNCTWTVPSTVSVVDIFAVGGGGGGGDDGGTGGGGGAGLSRSAVPVSPSSNLTIRVGYGGRGGLFNAWASEYGETSTVTTSSGATYNAPGGQGGGTRATGKGAGGSAAVNGTFAGGAGGTYPAGNAMGGVGNFGISNYFYGSLNTYAGGGGGGCYYDPSSNISGPSGRNGGGAGCSNTADFGQTDAVNGTAGTGGGGGGGGAGAAGRVIGGKGGSGVILIRYATNPLDAFPASVASALAGRWTPNELQVLDSVREAWVDASGTYARASITGNPVVSTSGTAESGNSTGTSKTNVIAAGGTGDKTTLIPAGSNLTNFTIFHVTRQPRLNLSGTTSTTGRVVTASSNNFISGTDVSSEKRAYHNGGYLTPLNPPISNRWILSTVMEKMYRADGRDLSYKTDSLPGVVGPNGLGINNYSSNNGDWNQLDLLVFNRQLTNGEVKAVEIYLSRIYGLTLDPLGQSSETDTAATMGNVSGNYYFFSNVGVGNTLNDTFTIETWVKPSSTCENSGAICQFVSKDYTVLLGTQQTTVNGVAGAYLYWALYSSGVSGSWAWTSTGIRIKTNEWTHVSMVKQYRGDKNGSLLFYINGKLSYTVAASPYGSATNYNSEAATYAVYDVDDRWWIITGRGDQWFYGDVDEFKVWKVARSESEVQGDMNSNDGSNSNLQMYYDFNKDSTNYLVSDVPVVPNQANGGKPRTDLYSYYATVFPTIESRSTDGPYTRISFPRTIITKNGGWKAPAAVSQVQTVLVGGGGGGGGGYQGGGGGAGGFIETVTAITPGTIYPIVVGVGGRGALNPLTPTNGDSTSAFSLSTLGGGAGASEYQVSSANVQYAAGAGGSGGGGNWSVNFPGGSGVTGQGNRGGSSADFNEAACGTGNIVFVGGGGGGAGSVGENASCTKGGNGGTGRASTVLGTVVAGGGGGSLRPFSRSITSTVRGLAGSGGGGIAGWSDGSAITSTNGPGNGSANTGGGGGAGYSSLGALGVGGAGGSGVVAIRFITAAKPAYTKPTTAYLNVGMTETFTTNVAQDSATAVLTRTFKWESTTPTANGSYTTLKAGTGASNASYSWVPSDTSTTGSGYLYRLTVTDSDTAGLFITDSSTAYAVINPALKVTSTVPTNSLAKKINISRSETFTITLGTPTYRATLSPVIPGISIDTSTAGSVILRIGDTATVGTWLETLTVTDSVAASVLIPLTINIAAPPTLLNSGEIVSNGLVLNLDAGNSQSLLFSETTTATNAIWRDLSGNGKDAQTSGTFDSRTCTAPVYSPYQGGYMNFNGSSDCFWSPYVGYQMEKSFTVETWFKLNGTSFNAGASIISQNYSSKNINFVLGDMLGNNTITVAFYEGTWRQCATGFTPTNGVWNHIVGTYDGVNMILYVNGAQFCTVAFSGGLSTNVSYDGTWIGRRHDGDSRYYANGSIATARVYRVPLTAAQVAQNFNATKARFDKSNTNLLIPTQKYGSRTVESFTATSGYETDTVIFAVGDRNGIDWDTTTVLNQINLTIQESLTVGTYLDTVTVTDSLGQSTYLPLKMTVTKADTLTVYVETPTALSYTGNRANITPVLKTIGAVGLESGTALSATLNFKPGGTTCATGGYCRVGDIGPAGGVIFIDTSTASSNGRIFEAAPQNWSGSDDLASVAQFCTGGAAATANITSGSQIGIGWGETLTANFDAGCTGGAAQVAADLNLNGYSDWFVPSENEAVQLYTYRNQVGLIQLGSNWSTGNWGYWTSTENSASVMRIISNASGWSIGNGDKSQANKFMLRPVRSFKPCWAVDTCTSLSTTDTPTAAGLYNITPSALTNITDLLTKYTTVTYASSSMTINKVAPTAVTIPWINTNYPETFTVNFTSTSGNQTIRYSTSNGTASGCTLDYKKIYTTSQGTCTVTITRAADRNFTADTTTATIFFLAFVNSQPTGLVGSGSTIALNGATSLETSTVLPPSITGLSTLTLSIGAGGTFTITGTGFTGSIEVKFWRNKVVSATSGNGTAIEIPVASIGSIGATSGRISVTTSAGQAVSVDTLTITP